MRAADRFAGTVLPMIVSLQKIGSDQPQGPCNRVEQPWRSDSARRRMAGVERTQFASEKGYGLLIVGRNCCLWTLSLGVSALSALTNAFPVSAYPAVPNQVE